MVESATTEANIQTSAGIIPSGVVSGSNWEMYTVPSLFSISFKRSDWKKPVCIPVTRLRAFVLA